MDDFGVSGMKLRLGNVSQRWCSVWHTLVSTVDLTSQCPACGRHGQGWLVSEAVLFWLSPSGAWEKQVLGLFCWCCSSHTLCDAAWGAWRLREQTWKGVAQKSHWVLSKIRKRKPGTRNDFFHVVRWRVVCLTECELEPCPLETQHMYVSYVS